MDTPSPPPIEAAKLASRRPVVITVICVIGFIGGLLVVPRIFGDTARSIGAWYPLHLAFSAAAGFVCFIGLWKMRRWGVFAYTGFFLVNQAFMLAMGVWSIYALVIPGVFIAIMFSKIEKMS